VILLRDNQGENRFSSRLSRNTIWTSDDIQGAGDETEEEEEEDDVQEEELERTAVVSREALTTDRGRLGRCVAPRTFPAVASHAADDLPTSQVVGQGLAGFRSQRSGPH
jgi:hypothetical protein